MRTLFFVLLVVLSAFPVLAQSDDLTKYFQKYPFDSVDGETFWQNRNVQEVVRRSVSSKFLQEMLLDAGSTTAPIDGVGGYMQAWACEQHNCGDHNWVVAIKNDGSKGAVCYFNKDLSNGARWFVNAQKVFDAPFGQCETGRLPRSVLRSLSEL